MRNLYYIIQFVKNAVTKLASSNNFKEATEEKNKSLHRLSGYSRLKLRRALPGLAMAIFLAYVPALAQVPYPPVPSCGVDDAGAQQSFGGRHIGGDGGSQYAFFDLSPTGVVRVWGTNGNSSVTPPSVANNTGIVNVVSTNGGMAGIRADGTVTVFGGTTGVGATTVGAAPGATDKFWKVVASGQAWTGIRIADSTLYMWGTGTGAFVLPPTTKGWKKIVSNAIMYAGVNANGTIGGWGQANQAPSVTTLPTGNDFVDVWNMSAGFVFKRADGTLAEWRAAPASGFTYVTPTAAGADGAVFVSGIRKVTAAAVGSNYTYVALLPGGFISRLFGDVDFNTTGGVMVQPPLDGGYVRIFSNDLMFIAQKADGTVHAFGYQSNLLTNVWNALDQPDDYDGNKYTDVVMTAREVYLRKADGTWDRIGTTITASSGQYIDNFNPATAYTQIVCSRFTNTAGLRPDGGIDVWGGNLGTGTGLSNLLNNKPTGTGFVSLGAAGVVFTAMKADGSYVTWDQDVINLSNATGPAGSIRAISGRLPVGTNTLSTCLLNGMAANGTPTAVNDTKNVNKNTTANIDVQANDSDPDSDVLTTTVISTLHGTTTVLATDSIAYTPTTGYVGLDTLTYKVCDPSGACDTAQVFITVVGICNAGTLAPIITETTVTNTCPTTTFSLAGLTNTGTKPAGTSLIWSTHKVPTSAADTLTNLTTVATAGKYYALYYDKVNGCYSPADSVDASITACSGGSCALGSFSETQYAAASAGGWAGATSAAGAPDGNFHTAIYFPGYETRLTYNTVFVPGSDIVYSAKLNSGVGSGGLYFEFSSDNANWTTPTALLPTSGITSTLTDYTYTIPPGLTDAAGSSQFKYIRISSNSIIEIDAVQAVNYFCKQLIPNVFIDNGAGGGTAGNCVKDGTETITASTGLYYNLVQNLNVKYSYPVSDGVYFSKIPDGNYSLVVTNSPTAIIPIAPGYTITNTTTSISVVNGVFTPSTLTNCIKANDSDGDAISDITDLDDDNDGILDTIECPALLDTPIVTNGSFSDSTFSGWGNVSNFWSILPHPATIGLAYNANDAASNNIFNQTIDLSQALVVSGYYTFNFKTFTNGAGNAIINSLTADLKISFNNTLFATISNPSGSPTATVTPSNGALVNISTFPIIDPSISIELTDLNLKIPVSSVPVTGVLEFSFDANGDDIGITGISVDKIPLDNPNICDTDGDGIANFLDLDSDNDGCSDAIEGGASFTNANLVTSTMPGGNTGTTSGTFNQPVTQNLGISVNTSGVPTIAGSPQTLGTSANAAALDAQGNCGSCLAGTAAPIITATTVTNTCPTTTFSLAGLTNTGTKPAGTSLIWSTHKVPTSAADTLTNLTTVATAGKYYALYYDKVNGCYSPADSVVATVISCSTVTCTGTTIAAATIAPTTGVVADNYAVNSNFTIQSLTPGGGYIDASTGYRFGTPTATTDRNYKLVFSSPVTNVVLHLGFINNDIIINSPAPAGEEAIANITAVGAPGAVYTFQDFSTGGMGNIWNSSTRTISSTVNSFGPNSNSKLQISSTTPFTEITLTHDYITGVNPFGVLLEDVCYEIACPAGTTAPIITATTVTNTCPTTTFSLAGLTNTGTKPAGTSLIWSTHKVPTSAADTLTNLTTVATAGKYYALYYDKVNGCYSPADSVVATITSCVTNDYDGDTVADAIDLDDDNDGILDADESECLGSPITLLSAIQKTGIIVTTSLTNSGGALSRLIDGDQGTTSSSDPYWANAQSIVNKTVLQFQFPTPKAINMIEVMQSTLTPMISGTYKIQGSADGTSWNDITGSTSTPPSAESTLYVATNYFAQDYIFPNAQPYTYYRIYGLTGTTSSNPYIDEANFTEPCINNDTDGDGLVNMYDLDSDGDSCPDAIEGGANFAASVLTASTLAGGGTNISTNLGNSVDTNGIPNPASTTGQTIGFSEIAAVQSANCPCNDVTEKGSTCDYDADGVVNATDLDDDNDGIIDTNESNCAAVNPTTFPTFSSYDYYSGGTPFQINQVLIDGIISSNIDQGPSSIMFADSAVFRLKGVLSSASGITFTLYNDAGVIGNTEGWRSFQYAVLLDPNGKTVSAIPAMDFGPVGDAVNEYTITFPGAITNASKLVFYGIQQRNNSSNLYKTWGLRELAGPTTGFSPICSDKDTDGDGIADRLDLDADNDGCSDAIEGGASFTSANLVASTMPGGNTGTTSGTYNQPVTQNLGIAVDGSGVPTIAGSPQTVGSSANAAALDAQGNCVLPCSDPLKMAANCDFDGDGVINSIDLDDDNDGILDTVECFPGDFELNAFTGNVNSLSGTVNGVNYTLSLVPAPGATFNAGASYPAPYDVNNSVFDNTATFFSSSNYTPATPLSDGITTLAVASQGANVGTATFTFSAPVTNPVLHLNNIDGASWDASATSGITSANIVKLSGNSHLTVNGTTIESDQPSVYDLTSESTFANQIESGYGSIKLIGTFTTISFNVKYLGITGGNDGTIWRITTDVVCDTDGDGIANGFDLDSDNDGCSDAIEGGASFTSANLVASTIPGGNTGTTSGTYNQPVTQNLGIAVDGTGVPTIAGSPQTVGTSANAAALDAQGNCVTCLAGTAAPIITQTTVTNTCPTTTFSLAGLTNTGTKPAGTSLIWSTHKVPTSAADTLTNLTTVATAGKYYALYYDAVNGCYSPADSVDATITTCGVTSPVCSTIYMINGFDGSVSSMDPTTGNLTLETVGGAPMTNGGNQGNIAIGPDPANLSNVVVTSSKTASGSTVYVNNVSTGLTIPLTLAGLTANPLTTGANAGNVFGISSTKHLVRVTPTINDLGVITGDATFTAGTISNDAFFDTAGNIYTIITTSSNTYFVYKINTTTLVSTQVIQITGLPAAYNIQGIAYNSSTNSIYTIKGYSSLPFGNSGVQIYKTNMATGVATFVGQKVTHNTTSVYDLDLGSCDVYAANCLAGTTAPAITPTTVSNTCPTTTFSLAALANTGTQPAGTSLVWSTHKVPTSAADTLTNLTTVATAGKYYALYYDKVNGCYSPADSVVASLVICAVTPAGQTANVSQPKTGTASTELTPTGGNGTYTYSVDNSGACTPAIGATALPGTSNLTVTNASTGAYTYTAPAAAGTYYFCIKVCDTSSPTPSCLTKTYTVVVSAPVCAVGNAIPSIK